MTASELRAVRILGAGIRREHQQRSAELRTLYEYAHNSGIYEAADIRARDFEQWSPNALAELLTIVYGE